MHMRHKHIKHQSTLLSSFILLALASIVQADIDYRVKAVVPELAADKQTRLLIDFTDKRHPVVKARGSKTLIDNQTTVGKDGGTTGTFKVAVPGNFDPGRFTIELILRIPEGSQGQYNTTLARWHVAHNYSAMIRMDQLRIDGPGNVAGRNKPFQLSCPYANNGWSISRQATGQWVYLAAGMDLEKQVARAVVRDMSGKILFERMEMIGIGEPTGVKDKFDAARLWREMAGSVATSLKTGKPSEITFGHPSIELRKVRISDSYREDVLSLDAEIPSEGATQWLPTDLDSKRTESETVSRLLGYSGYRNGLSFPVTERFIPLSANSDPIVIPLKDMKIGLYTLFLHGTISPLGRTKLDRVWKPCPMEMVLLDKSGKRVGYGKLLLKQSLRPRRMQGFHLHINEPGDYTVKLQLTDKAQETARILRIVLVDQLAELPNIAIKSQQTFERAAVPMQRLSSLDDARLARDRDIWSAMPPLNLHLQVHGQTKVFAAPPSAAKLDQWQTKVFAGKRGYAWGQHAIAPLDFVNTQTKKVFTQEQILNGEPWPGPYSDDGTGIYFTQSEFPELKHDVYYTPRASLLGRRAWLFVGLLGAHDYRGLSLPAKYFKSGDANTGHDAAMAMVRVAYDWPALEMNLHEIRLCTHSPDLEYNSDWSKNRNGKYFYQGWSGNMLVDFMVAYDQVFPYIKDNQVFADAVNKHIPWIKTPNDVIAFLDRHLVFAGVRDFNRGLISAAPIEDYAAKLLGPHAATEVFYDLTRQYAKIYPFRGTYQELYGSALSRSGSYHIGSFLVYALGSASETVLKARTIGDAKKLGVNLKMDLSDVDRYTKVRAAGDFMLNMWVAGGFPFMVGDASGGTHTPPFAAKRIGMIKDGVRAAFDLTGNSKHAWVLQHILDDTSPEVVAAAKNQRDPITHAESRVVADYGAIIELGVNETDITKKTAATLRLGTAQGHAHSDYLDLNIFAMGLPMSVDLACRDEGNHWSRPGASWAFLHNHAIAHADENPRQAGAQSGEPWLKTFAPPLVRARYVNQQGDVQLDRDVLMMSVGDTGQYYAFDLQRLTGGKMHTWCFHGCESEDVVVNTTMSPQTVRWIDRTLRGSHKVGRAPKVLTATWTMTRNTDEHPHNFKGGGVIKTVAAEPSILGERYDPSLPPARIRATLLNCEGDTVLQGSPFSQPYSYAFPFIWVQRNALEGDAPSVYPAIYEWYRGDQPIIAEAAVIGRSPLVVRVVTTTGQTDTFTVTPNGVSAISRDANGVRFVQMNGLSTLQAEGVSLGADRNRYEATITSIDYASRQLTVDRDLPENPAVSIGNDGRQIHLELTGKGRTFSYAHDLLVHEGLLTSINILDDKIIELQTNQRLFHGDKGNRKLRAFAVTNEDHTWAFRGFGKGTVIHRPNGAHLNKDVFTDANGDGRINVKTYEIGVGDTVTLPANVIIRRSGDRYEIQGNVSVSGRVDGETIGPKR